MHPTDRRYSKEHEWIRNDGETVRVGITDFAQQELGDIVFVELPDVGRQVKAGDVIGTIESVKAVSEIFSPISGEIVAVNEVLTDGPEQVNSDPHGDGWYCSIKPADSSELDALMDAAAYEKLIGS